MVWKTLVAQQRTNAQINSHMALAGNRTGVTLVRGERFMYKPTMPPSYSPTRYLITFCSNASGSLTDLDRMMPGCFLKVASPTKESSTKVLYFATVASCINIRKTSQIKIKKLRYHETITILSKKTVFLLSAIFQKFKSKFWVDPVTGRLFSFFLLICHYRPYFG